MIKAKVEEIKEPFDLMSLDRRLIENIIEYLPIQDLINCLKTSKKMYSIVKNHEELWKEKYDKSYNPKTFPQFNIKDFQFRECNDVMHITLSSSSEHNDYYDKVIKAKSIQTKWQTNSPKNRRKIQLFNNL